MLPLPMKVAWLRFSIAPAVLAVRILSAAEPPQSVLDGPAVSRADPLGHPGLTAIYRHERPDLLKRSVVETFGLALGAVETEGGVARQWLHLHATKTSGTSFQVWFLCECYPAEALTNAEQAVARYVLQEGDAEPLEYRNRSGGRAVLPVLGVWPHLLPRRAEGADLNRGFPAMARLLGHRYQLERVEHAKPSGAPLAARILNLTPDCLIGVPHNTKPVDDTRRYDGSDYRLIPLTEADYDVMIGAGMNCFYAEAPQRRWIERRAVFYWGGGMGELPYPECFYRSGYLGPVLFLDEPAVVTRDSVIRPRLRQDPGLRKRLTPGMVREAFHEHFRRAKYEGGPAELIRGLAARPDVDVGDMHFLQQNVFTWETMVSTAIDQLTEGGAPPPSAMVFEPPGRLGTRRTLPEMDMSYGCQIPADDPASLTGILYGFLRGAARLADRDWGTSIYGAVDRADSPWLLTRAYDLGARLFFFWDTAALACVPFRECLSLSRHLREHAESHPDRDLGRLKRAAEVLLLLPPGYNLGHVQMGKGSLWGLGELNLERTNTHGLTYRAIMRNLFLEIERCIRLGTAYDIVWDVPGLDLAGYRELVHVREDGKVEVRRGADRTLLDGPREAARPDGQPPRLTVTLTPETARVPVRLTAQADVVETSAPVYYTVGANRRGVYENAVVLWELFGPQDEDYRVLLGEDREPQIQHNRSAHRVVIHFGIDQAGVYRLRAATVDQAGRSTVVWKNIAVSE